MPRILLPLLALIAAPASAQTEAVPSPYAFGYNYDGAAVYDAERGVVVMHNTERARGSGAGTVMMEWDGAAWRAIDATFLFSGEMVYDARRQRAVLHSQFGTHEWDGVDWIQRSPGGSGPVDRVDPAMAFDAGRGVAVLFGGRALGPGGELQDTWEWDGVAGTWRRVATTAAPPPRSEHVMTYDPVRGKVLLFGGRRGAALLGDTWEYDGAQSMWRQVATGGPSPRDDAALTYDSARGRAILYGGSGGLRDTWEWQSATAEWHLVPTTRDPGARSRMVMAFDAARGTSVLFGGLFFNDPGYADTWVFDGSDWQLAAENGSPPRGLARSVAYDRARDVAVLFTRRLSTGIGETWEWGRGWRQRDVGSGPPGNGTVQLAWDERRQRVVAAAYESGMAIEVWEWDGSARVWRQVPAASPPPPPRGAFGWCAEPGSGRVLLFGGVGVIASSRRNDTWAWDGASRTWTQLTPVDVPPPRWSPALAADVVRDRVVMYSGATSSLGGPVDTWEWDGANWQQATPAIQPPGAPQPTAAFDVARRRTVVHAPWRGGTGEFWEWDGVEWRQRAASLPNQAAPTMVYDAASREVVVLSLGPASNLATDLYRPVQPARYDAFGSGCVGTGVMPTLGSRPWSHPWLGEVFTARVEGIPFGHAALMMTGGSRTQWGPIGLPFSLAVIGIPDCSLLISPDIVQVLPAAVAGTAEWTATIPPITTLLGQVAFQQGLVLDPGASGPPRGAATNGARLLIGGH